VISPLVKIADGAAGVSGANAWANARVKDIDIVILHRWRIGVERIVPWRAQSRPLLAGVIAQRLSIAHGVSGRQHSVATIQLVVRGSSAYAAL